MKSYARVIALVAAVAAVGGCAGSRGLQGASAKDIPKWFDTPPEDPNYLFSAKTATSRDLQMAIDGATQAARTEIARQTEVKVSALQKRFQEEVGVGDDSELMQQFTQASKTVVSTSTGTGTGYRRLERSLRSALQDFGRVVS